MTGITPIQANNRSITGTDVAITAGGTALGALAGGIVGYNLKPTGDQFVKGICKFMDKAEIIGNTFGSAENLLSAIGKVVGMDNEEIKHMVTCYSQSIIEDGSESKTELSLTTKLKNVWTRVKNCIRKDANIQKLEEGFNGLDDNIKNDLKPLVRKGNMLKWGGIIGSTAAFLTVCGIAIMKKNNKPEKA